MGVQSIPHPDVHPRPQLGPALSGGLGIDVNAGHLDLIPGRALHGVQEDTVTAGRIYHMTYRPMDPCGSFQELRSNPLGQFIGRIEGTPSLALGGYGQCIQLA